MAPDRISAAPCLLPKNVWVGGLFTRLGSHLSLRDTRSVKLALLDRRISSEKVSEANLISRMVG